MRRLVLLPLLLAMLASPLQAAERKGLQDLSRGPAGSSFAPAPGISIEKATAIARKHTGGRVLSASPKTRATGTDYQIRMLVDGERVITVTVDHQGRIKNKR
jgi:hypothetical protein